MPCGVRTFLPRIAPPTIVWKSFAVRGRTLPALAHFFNSLDEFSRFFDARLDALCDNDGFCGPRRLDAASPLPIQTTYKKAAPPDAGGRKAMNIKMKTLAAATAAAACAAGQAHAGFLEAVIDTTPAGYVSSSAERPGDFGSFWQDTVRGAKAIMKEGNSLWVVPTYTNHPTWDWDKRHEENGYPFGMGLGRQVIDNRGNERSFFLVTFVDSNYRPEPVAGYQWVARWPVAGTGLHVGAGYLAAVSARGDYMWVPFPMPLPVAKIGTDDISFYGTYIPVTNVFFFYSTITIDDAKRRDLPLPATSAWSADRNYLYGGWGWEYMDNGEEFSPSNVKNDSSWHVGMRHYSGRHWATDVSYRRSEHDIKTAGTDTSKSYRFQIIDLGRPASVQHRRPRQPPPLRGRRSGLLQDEGPRRQGRLLPPRHVARRHLRGHEERLRQRRNVHLVRPLQGHRRGPRRRLRAQAHGDRLHALPGRGVLTPHESVPDATPVNGAFRLFR